MTPEEVKEIAKSIIRPESSVVFALKYRRLWLAANERCRRLVGELRSSDAMIDWFKDELVGLNASLDAARTEGRLSDETNAHLIAEMQKSDEEYEQLWESYQIAQIEYRSAQKRIMFLETLLSKRAAEETKNE